MKTSKAKKPGTMRHSIFLKVLWGDAVLGSRGRNLAKCSRMTVGKGFRCDVQSIVWPLFDDLEIIERHNGKLYLNPDIPWNGMIVAPGYLSVLDSRKREKKKLELPVGCFATVRYEGVTFAIRIGLEHVEAISKDISAKYRPKILGLISDTSQEKLGLAAGLIVGGIFTAALGGGLALRTTWRPQTLAEIDDDMKLPFIAPSHFTHAPDVLQTQLDRGSFVNSVTRYYHTLAEIMTSNEHSSETARSSFPGTSEVYDRYKEQQEADLHQKKSEEERFNKSVASQGGKILSIPVARGESIDGSILRVLDKIEILAEHSAELNALRRETATKFQADETYDYGSQEKSATPDANLAEFTKALGAGFRKSLPDEELQVAEAKKLAVRATTRQIKLFGENSLKPHDPSCCMSIIGVEPATAAVHTTSFPDLSSSDNKIAEIRASQWGAPAPNSLAQRIIEPTSGSIDEKALESSIVKGRFQLQLCFELALRRNQATSGSMEWKWNVTTKGEASSVSLLNSTIKDEELIHCVRTRIAKWKFPKAKGGSVEVRYPFEFVKDKG